MPTVLHRLAKWAEATPDYPAQKYKEAGVWKTITAKDFCDRVYYLALFLESRGITAKDVGGILSYNSPEWVQIELAVTLLGGQSAGLYPNASMKDIHYILNLTECGLLSVQNREYFNKITGGDSGSTLPDFIRLVLVFDGDTSVSPKAVAFKDAVAEGRKLSQKPGATTLFQYLAKLDPKNPAFMIFTSGTTGNPKGAVLSHDNLAFASDVAEKQWKIPRTPEVMFSFLPLCHVAEKLQNVGVSLSLRHTVAYATKFENLATELPEVEPTILLCVPRLWEKMMEGVMSKISKAPPTKKALAKWALGVAQRVGEAKFQKKSISPLDQAQYILARKLVVDKIRKALGLRRTTLAASGAAPLPPHVVKWFRSFELYIEEDYGQTESSALICMTDPGVESAGTVGRPAPGTEFKIAEDGEILTRGRHVFVGYFKNDAATKEAVKDGWLYTGDLAELTPQGLVKIRGRKKEIMKTSGGKMIAPLPIEEKLKASDLISQVCLVGDGRKYVSALITLREAVLHEVGTKQGSAEGLIITSPDIVGGVKKAVEDLNQQLAGFEQIKRFTVLSREFSIVEGEMTPTLKIKRNVIETRFRDVIDQMYS